jgi:transcriptional regulator with XRE-family HTH domain
MTKVLAENVRRLRKERKFSQTALAERAGMSLRGIQEIEYENAWPELTTIEAIAAALAVPPGRLFHDPDLKPSPEDAITVLSELVKASKKQTPV